MTKLVPLQLVGECFSPWTKKARWALEQCGLAYNYQEYTPTLSEPGLRWRLKQLRGSVSVPILFAGNDTLRDSWEIAKFANTATSDKRLGDMQTIKHWNDLSEAALAEGRTTVVRCILNNQDALKESLPGFVPNALRDPMRFVARDAVKRLDRKYAHLLETGALRKALLATRQELVKTNNDFLLGNFSYADIAMAVVVEVIAPIAQNEPALGPATQQCWRNAELSNEFSDLIDWRNRLAIDQATTYSQFNIE